MNRTDFSYQLPPQLIAQHPLAQRSASRLLALDGSTGKLSHHHFTDLLDFLHKDDLLVFNDTRVIPARLWGHKATGGKVEIVIERVTGTHTALAHLRASKSPRPGTAIHLSNEAGGPQGNYGLTVTGREGELFCVSSEGGPALAEILAAIGHMPLPPYIERGDDELDQQRYQTVYAQRDGAVAAPTAGLHFTEELLRDIDQRGIRRAHVTLHVGAGTFAPVRAEHLDQHKMHAEFVEVGESTCQAIRSARARGGRIIAVGTTTVRSLETATAESGEIVPYCGDTDIFIYPGYRFRSVDAIITNFHLPESTLLMLISAFAGREFVMAAYAAAIESGYRFFSYGDAMFITANPTAKGIT